MVQIKAHEVDRYIARPDQFHAVILIYGPDEGAVSERADAIVSHLRINNHDPFGLVRVEADDVIANPGILADEMNTIALFGGKRTVRLKNYKTRPVHKSVDAVIESNPQDAHLVIEAGDLKKSNPLRKLVEQSKTAIALPCYTDDTRSIRQMIIDETSSHGLQIGREALELLQSRLGEDRRASRNEIRKLCLFASGQTVITTDDVEHLIGDVSASILDDTVDATFSGNANSALENFNRSVEIGTLSFLTAQALSRHASLLANLTTQIQNGTVARTAVDQSKPPIFFKRKTVVIKHLAHWDTHSLSRAQEIILDSTTKSRAHPTLTDTVIRSAILTVAARAKVKR